MTPEFTSDSFITSAWLWEN